MANRKPLVLVSGEPQQLQAGDTLVDGSGSPISASPVPTGTGFRHVTAGVEDAAAYTDVQLFAQIFLTQSLRL
jgi:hypothetical protein